MVNGDGTGQQLSPSQGWPGWFQRLSPNRRDGQQLSPTGFRNGYLKYFLALEVPKGIQSILFKHKFDVKSCALWEGSIMKFNTILMNFRFHAILPWTCICISQCELTCYFCVFLDIVNSWCFEVNLRQVGLHPAAHARYKTQLITSENFSCIIYICAPSLLKSC